MFATSFFLLLALVSQTVCRNSSTLMVGVERFSTSDYPISEIFEECFTANTGSLTINMRSSSRKGRYSQGYLVQSILKNKTSVKVCVESKLVLKNKYTIRYDNLFVIEDLKSLRSILKSLPNGVYSHLGHYVIILSGKKVDLYPIFAEIYKHNLLNAVVLLTEENKVLLYTFFPYSVPNNCSDLGITKINSFDIKTKLFSKTIDIFPKKLENFNNCPLKVLAMDNPPYVIFGTKELDNDLSLQGIEGNILKKIAKKRNFTIDLIQVVRGRNKMWGEVGLNDVATGALATFVSKKADLAIGGFILANYTNIISASSAHMYTNFIIAIPPKTRYGPLTELTLPFTWTTWITISVMLIAILVMIIALQYVETKKRDFIIGQNVQHPILNLVMIFLGGSVPRQPARNFARTLLIIWFLFTLIIRSVYIARLYHLFRSGNRHWALEMFKDIEGSGYPVWAEDQVFNIFKDKSTISRLTYSKDSIDDLLFNLLDKNYEGVVMTTQSNIDYYNTLRLQQDVNNEIILISKDTRIPIAYRFAFRKNSYLQTIFEQDVFHLISSGILKMWIQDLLNPKTKGKSEIITLKFESIKGVFVVLIIGIIFATIVLVCEICWQIFTKNSFILKIQQL